MPRRWLPQLPPPLTQLALLLALSLIGSVLSYGFGRLEVGRVALSATIQRAEGALERASLGVLRIGAVRGLLLLAVPALGLVGFGLLGGSRAGVSGLGRAAFLLLALLVGAASAVLQARVTLSLGARAAAAAASSVARGSARALRPLIRAAAAAAVFGEALGLLGISAAFAGLYAVRGGFVGAGNNAELVSEVVRLLPAFALGAAVISLSLSRTGSVTGAATQVGAGHASFPEAGLSTGDARDPALLAELVGQLVGEVLPRALVAYVVGAGATVSLALLAVSGTPSPGALAGLVLALMIRAFGAIGSVCGVFATRSSEEEPTIRALVRGLVSALCVALFGLGAALFWLDRDKLGPLLGSGALGLSLTTLVSLLAWLPLRRRGSASRELQEGRGSGAAAAIARGTSAGFAGSWPALLVPALLLALSERLSGFAPAPLLLITFVAGALALAPLALAFGGFGALAVHSRGVASLARLELEPARRAGGFEDAVALAERTGATHAALALGLALLVGFLAFNGTSPGLAAGSVGLSLVAIALGVVLVLAFGAVATRRAVLAARGISAEVERQLQDSLKRSAETAEPSPSYKQCLDGAMEAARSLPLVEVAALLLAPFLFAVALRETGSALTPTLLSFGLAALLTGVVVSLGARATRAWLTEQRKRSRADLVKGTLAEADTFGALVGVSAAANVEALVLSLSLTVICLAPLLR